MPTGRPALSAGTVRNGIAALDPPTATVALNALVGMPGASGLTSKLLMSQSSAAVGCIILVLDRRPSRAHRPTQEIRQQTRWPFRVGLPPHPAHRSSQCQQSKSPDRPSCWESARTCTRTGLVALRQTPSGERRVYLLQPL